MNTEYVCEDSSGVVWHNPSKGDLLCFDGNEWKVARRNGWNYPVEDPQPKNPEPVDTRASNLQGDSNG